MADSGLIDDEDLHLIQFADTPSKRGLSFVMLHHIAIAAEHRNRVDWRACWPLP